MRKLTLAGLALAALLGAVAINPASATYCTTNCTTNHGQQSCTTICN